MGGPSEGLGLEITRSIPAVPRLVFAAFTDPNELVKWWGPKGFTVASPEFSPRVGARYRIEMRPPGGDPFYITGEFRAIVTASRLAFTFVYEPPDPDDVPTLVDLSFRDLGGSTEIVLTQGPFKTQERRALHHAGWTDSFDKLEGLLSGTRPGRRAGGSSPPSGMYSPGEALGPLFEAEGPYAP